MNNKILIVEDEFITANALRLLLEQAGHCVTGIASSVEEACKFVQKQKPDLVLLDIRLEGEGSGIDLARKLKDLNIAFIYLSANSNQKILEEAKKTEPYGFLVKPYREKDVLVALEIAAYRHNSSLESKSRQQEIIQKQLTGLPNKGSGQILSDIAGILQPHIPFDLIISGDSFPDGRTGIAHGYMRTGYDEYHPIDKQEYHYNSTESAIFGLGTSLADTDSAFIKTLKEHFRMDSCLAFPVCLGNGAVKHYFFCSRKHDVYQHYHLDLLSGIGTAIAQASSEDVQESSPRSSGRVDQARASFGTIIGSHPLLLAALDLTVQVAPFATSVLLLGESGTGKEKIAEAVHTLSKRNGPLIKVNCGAIPATLIESELFGYEKGAFTGANENRKGKFEQANGGTLFLDEIGELSTDLQVRLLRVLQQKEIDPIGGSAPRKVDVRIVAATNLNLEKAVAEGKFRLDLYYRLNVFPITLPALRERKSDILPLASYFAERFSRESGRAFNGIGTKMAETMLCYDWPGNIRELENVIERSVILNDERSELELRQEFIAANTDRSGKAVIESFGDLRNLQRETERDYIMAALAKTNGRIRGHDGAAEILNIKPTTLESKMAKLGISKEDFKN